MKKAMKNGLFSLKSIAKLQYILYNIIVGKNPTDIMAALNRQNDSIKSYLVYTANSKEQSLLINHACELLTMTIRTLERANWHQMNVHANNE